MGIVEPVEACAILRVLTICTSSIERGVIADTGHSEMFGSCGPSAAHENGCFPFFVPRKPEKPGRHHLLRFGFTSEGK